MKEELLSLSGDEYIYSWTGPNGFTSSTKDITNLSAGVYTLIAKDQNDCMQNFNFTVNSMSCGASQIIDLIEGWSIISTYIDPIDDNIENVFDDVIGNVSTQPNFIEVVVKDELGNVFWPYFGLNSIGDLTIGKGYQVKMNFFNQLEIYGDVIPYNTPLILNSGWGLLGYLHQDPYNVEFLMESIVDELNPSASNLIILKAGDGNVYWPTFSLNNIGNLNPGEGYQIKMNTTQVFSYPNISGQRNDNFNIQESIHFEKPMQTDQNMTIGIPYYAWQETPKIGDEIAAFDQNGNIIGISIFNGNHLALTIWGDDVTTYHKDGANEYEKISFKLWDSVNNTEKELEFVWERGGDSYIKNGISIAQNIILNNQGDSKNIISITDILGREINSEIKIKFFSLNMMMEIYQLNIYLGKYYSFLFIIFLILISAYRILPKAVFILISHLSAISLKLMFEKYLSLRTSFWVSGNSLINIFKSSITCDFINDSSELRE